MSLLSQLSHPNVVRLVGAHLAGPTMCIVQELMAQSLEEVGVCVCVCVCGGGGAWWDVPWVVVGSFPCHAAEPEGVG